MFKTALRQLASMTQEGIGSAFNGHQEGRTMPPP